MTRRGGSKRGIITLATALAIVLFGGLLPTGAAFADIQSELAGNRIDITGDAQDFRIVAGGNTIFDISAMLPGESSGFSRIVISNTQDMPYTLSAEVEDVGSYSPLLDYLDMVVRLDGNIIASFPAKGQPTGNGYLNPYPFGRIYPGVTVTIEVGLSLSPGSQMGNDLQERAAHFVWRFRAVSDQRQSTTDSAITGGGVFHPGGDKTIAGGSSTVSDKLIRETGGSDSGGGNGSNGGSGGGTGGSNGGSGTGGGAGETVADGDGPYVAESDSEDTLPELRNIDDEESPTTPPKQAETGDGKIPGNGGDEGPAWALYNLLLTILTAIFALIVLLRLVTARAHTAKERMRREGISLIVGAVCTVLLIILFILTEDMRLPMIYIDKYTIWHLIGALVALLFLVNAVRRHKDGEDDDGTQGQDTG
jgi:hypothetical protein